MAKEHVHGVFESIARQYDAANDRISLGMHRKWKEELVARASASALQRGADDACGMVLDVCCGTGDITQQIASAHPDVFVTGLDFSANMLQVAQQRTQSLQNVMLVEGNAMELPFDDGTFDAAVISFGLRNTPDYRRVVGEMARVVRPGGIVACLDASVPDSPYVKPFYQVYYRYIMTFLGGGISHHGEYKWLYQSTQEFLTKSQLAQLFVACGLRHVQIEQFMLGSAALHTGVKPA